MPLKSVPPEIRDRFETIHNRIKEMQPDWAPERAASVCCSVVKKLYYKDKKDSTWKPKEKSADWMFDAKNLDALVKMHMGDMIGDEGMENDKLYEFAYGRAEVIDPAVLAQTRMPESSEWMPKLFEQAGVSFDEQKDNLVDADFIYVVSWLCHADLANANRVYFTKEDLAEAIRRGNFTPYTPVICDINHSEVPTVGFVLQGTLERDPQAPEQAYGVKVLSVILNWGPYKEAGSKIIEAHSKGKLFYSMGCIPEYYQSKVEPHRIYKTKEDLYLAVGNDRTKWNTAFALRHPKFYTNSIIFPPAQPADQFAQGVDMFAELFNYASVNDQANSSEEAMDELKQQIATLASEKAALETVKTDLEAANETLKSEKADLETKNAELATQVTNLEQDKTQQAQTIAELTAKVDAFEQAEQKRIDDEKAAKVTARKTAVADLKLSLPEENMNFLNGQAETASDDQWNMLLSSITALAQASTEGNPKLDASEALGGALGSGDPAPKSQFASLMTAASKNLK